MDADEALRFVEELLRNSGSKPLNDLQRIIFRGAWAGKDYKEIHRDCEQVGLEHIMRNVGPRLWKRLSNLASERLGEVIEVRKEALRGPIERLRNSLLDKPSRASETSESELFSLPLRQPDIEVDSFESFWRESINRQQDWGQAPDTTLFLGRSRELATLSQWIEEDGCRLVALVGMAGIGKTYLSVKLTEHLRERFECIVWRSLDPDLTGSLPPRLPDLLTDLTQVLTNHPTPHLFCLMDCLRQQRCLIVLDGFEAVLHSNTLSGDYAPEYEAYSDFLKRVSDTQHQSCLLLTSREKPREIEAREGEQAPTRSLAVSGLTPDEIQMIFSIRGTFSTSEVDWRSLTYQYDGNPRFLHQVATTISSAFGRDISRFLNYQQNQVILIGDIRRHLEQQLERLSQTELSLIRELARHREPATVEEIRQFVKHPMSSHYLLEVLLSLVRRSLLRSSSISYSLHPLLIEFITAN